MERVASENTAGCAHLVQSVLTGPEETDLYPRIHTTVASAEYPVADVPAFVTTASRGNHSGERQTTLGTEELRPYV